MLVKVIWQDYAQAMLAIVSHRATCIVDVNSSGYAAIGPWRNSVRAVCGMDQTASLAASLALQQETYIHLVRIFLVEILTPFQVHSLLHLQQVECFMELP